MTDWAITIPKHVRWEDYEQELEAAAAGAVLNYRTARKVGVRPRDRVFVVWNGRVRGWHKAVGTVFLEHGLTCETTNRAWSPGWYVQRSGPFSPVDGPDMAGFRGIRRVNFEGDSMGHHCHARGCSTLTKPEMLMCLKHWRMVPRNLQKDVWAHYRVGQCDDKSPSKAWYAAADAAIAAVAAKEAAREAL